MIYPKLIHKYLIYILASFILYSCNVDQIPQLNVELTKEDSARLSLVEYHFSLSNYDSTFHVLDSFSKIEEYNNHKIFRLQILESKARLYIQLKKYQSALDIINLILLETENDRELYNGNFVAANLQKGDIYFGLGNYRTAYKYYYLGKESSKGKGENCTFAMYDYRISLILYRQNKYLESLKNFKKSFSGYNNCNNNDFPVKFRQQEILSNIGLCFYKLEMYDSSLLYYNKALSMVNRIKIQNASHKVSLEIAAGVIYGNIGKVYIATKEYNKAVPLLKKNISINSRVRYDNLDALTSILALGEYYLNQKDYENFKYILELPESYSTNPNYKEQILYLYELKSKYYEEVNNLNEALRNFKLYENIKDSITAEKQRNNDSDVQLSIESLERENELNKLTKESQKRKYYIYIAVYLSIGLIILIFAISIFLRLSNKKNISLKISNEEVNAQRELLKKANDEITINNDILKQRDIEKNKILSIVAHDLRNPNNAISSIAQNLKLDDNLRPDQIEYLNLIEISAKSSNDLIQEILYFAKPGQFETANEFKVVSCNELFLQIVSLNMFKANQKHIEIQYDQINPNIYININIEKIRRAFSNIIVNAIKFSHHHTKISIYSDVKENEITVHIKDNGIGIPDRIKDSIFISDPIIRRLGTDGEASFGLGLAIVKQIIEEHKGKIAFNSNIRGTTFSITLPLHKT